MFSFAMTSGLASDSDKFKIIITLRRAQKNGVTRPYENFIFLYNPFNPDLGGGRSVCLWRCRLLSVPLGEQASGRRWDCSGLDHVVRRCFGTKWYGEVPGGTEYPRWWHQQVGRQQFCWFFKLDKYAMFSFAMTSGLASDSDKFKIIITLRRAQKNGATRPYKNFIFLYNPSNPDSGGGRSVCLWRCRLLSVPLGEQASGRRWDCSGLDHVVRRCFGTKWYGEVPGARSTRDGDTSK